MTFPQAPPARRPAPPSLLGRKGEHGAPLLLNGGQTIIPSIWLRSLSSPFRVAGQGSRQPVGGDGGAAWPGAPGLLSLCPLAQPHASPQPMLAPPPFPRLMGDLWKEWLGGLGRLREQEDLTEVTADSWSEQWVRRPSPPRAHRQHQPLCVMSL